MDRRSRGTAWKIHGLALAAIVVLYVCLFGEALVGPPRSDLRGLVAVFTLMYLAVYAVVTSILMVWVGRRPWGPLVMHVLLTGGYIVATVLDDRAAAERQAESDRRDAVGGFMAMGPCVQIELRALLGAPPRATVEVHNICDVPLVVRDVALVGFTPAGSQHTLARDQRSFKVVGPHRHAAFLVASNRPDAPPVTDGWRWRCDVSIDDSGPGIPCFVSAGAPQQGCQPIRRVAVDAR